MEPGMTVFKAQMWMNPLEHQRPYYIQTGTVSDVVVNGKPMISAYSLLMQPDGWHTTEAEAKREVWRQLVRNIGRLQAQVDELNDEILHDDLTTEEVAA